MKIILPVLCITVLSLSFLKICHARDTTHANVAGTTDQDNVSDGEVSVKPEDYYFNVEALSTKEEDWKRLQFHGFFEVASPVQGQDDESQQLSSKFLDENELVLWLGKRISKRFSFASEVEIKKGFKKYELEILDFDYELIDKLLVFRVGKFKYPLGIERFVEAAPLNKLVDRPLPSIRVIPGTYTDIGAMFYGSIALPNNTMVKYEFAVTNGLAGPESKDVQQLWDNNSNKAIGGRLGYEFLQGLEIGGSYSRGKYDEDDQLDIDFLGADILYKKGNLEVRGEYITSCVEQKEGDGGNFSRNGYYLQTSYKYPVNLNYVKDMEGVLRLDSADQNQNIANGNEADRIAIGMNYFPANHVELKFEYELENEVGEGIHGKSFVQAIFRW